MRLKPVLLLFLFALIMGLTVGILDSFIHTANLVGSRMLNTLVFIVFFVAMVWFSVIYRNVIYNGYMSYRRSVGITFSLGIIASIVIGVIRYVYLNYIVHIDIENIVEQARNNMIQHYGLYPEELISNRLQFIEFSYDPLVSSTMYFLYYSLFTIIFGLLISLFVKRIDRDISIA